MRCSPEREVDRARDPITSLDRSSTEIEQVLALIEWVVEQTRLLPPIATIEAAGASEAGKGFAVVAPEVEDLIGQIAQAGFLGEMRS